MGEPEEHEHPPSSGSGAELLAIYDRALPQVYGYLSARAGNRDLAEDLTAETFLAAVQAVERNTVADQGLRFDLFRPRPGY